jgi:threonine dehydratase
MSENTASKLIPANKIYQSYRKNREIVAHTPLQRSPYLSTKYSANIFLKREDLQAIRSFKIRGAATAFRYMTE